MCRSSTKNGSSASHKSVKFWQKDAIQVLCLIATPFFPRTPCSVVEICVETSRTRIAAQTHTRRVVTLTFQQFREHRHFRPDGSLVAERDDLRRKHVHSAHHRGVAAGSRDMRAECVLEEGALRCQLVDMRRRQARIAVATEIRALSANLRQR